MKRILILILFAFIFLSGCLEKSQIFRDTESEILNQAQCDKICDEINDLGFRREFRCDQNSNCICICKAW